MKKKNVSKVLSFMMACNLIGGSFSGTSNLARMFETTVSAATIYNYYPKCSNSYGSLVDALKSIGVDSSYNNRKKIASVNNISNYSGTASQNSQLLSKLKNGTLIKSTSNIDSTTNTGTSYYPKCSNSYDSLVDALKSIGIDSSYSNREKIAHVNGISSYSGTVSQNSQLLSKLKNGTLIKSISTPSTSSSTSSPSFANISEGKYSIIPKCNERSCVDVSGVGISNGTNIHLWENLKNANQIFEARRNANGSYTFYATHTSNMVIDISGGNVFAGNNIQLYSSNGTKAQQFYIKDEGNGYFSIRSAINTNFAVDISGALTKNGTNIHIWEYNGTNAQLFRFTSTATIITNSNYNISVSDPASKNKPHYENSAGNRSKTNYNTVIDQFNVANNSRYKQRNGKTYCNIFAWDIMTAMKVQLPHWINSNNVPAEPYSSGAKELNANATYNWLNNYGEKYGWRKVSAYDAQQRANSGYPTIAIWKNPTGGSGHVMVIRPEGNGFSYKTNNPVISQAGSTNINYWNVKNALGNNTPVYWTCN